MTQHVYSLNEIVEVYGLGIIEQNALKDYLLERNGRIRDGALYSEFEVHSMIRAIRPSGPIDSQRGMQPFTVRPVLQETRKPSVAPLQVLSHAEIIRRYQPTEEEFYELLERLRDRRKKLTVGGFGYFLSDVEPTIAAIRHELQDRWGT